MARLFHLFILVVFIFLFSLQPCLAFRSVAVGSKAPSLTVKDRNGRDVTLSFGQRHVVLLFWRPDQSFSRHALEDLQKVMGSFAGEKVEVLAIAEGGTSPSSVERTAKSLRLSYSVYLDAQRKAEEKYGVLVFPSTGIIGPDRQLKFYLPSRNSNYREILRGRLRVELGLMKENEFEHRMQRMGEKLGSERLKAEEHLKRGLLLSRQGKALGATKELRQAVDLDPSLIDAHLALGYAYLDSGRLDVARKEFDWVLERHPTSPAARMGVGITEVRRGHLDNGIEILRKAVELNPDPVQGYYELGMAYEQRKNLEAALGAYKWAVKKLLQGRR